ncbi:MAG: hypothetical protein QM635_02265 [Microbacteriaceae bacterium]
MSGTARYGYTLIVSVGSWDVDSVSYQWYRDTSATAGATGTAYTIVAADVGRVPSVRATGHRPRASDQTVTRAPAGKVAAGKVAAATFKKTVTPRITGTLKTGKKVKARASGFGKTITVKYRWYR